MNNRITLYPNCKILEWKNFSVDDLEDYLLTLSHSLSFSQTQYIKHALELSIKINLDEDELDYNILKSHNYNYLMAQNEDSPRLAGKKVYYFIVDKKWMSQNCIEFKLKMDTVNTFKDLSISPKTTILRQHKNRWGVGSDVGIYAPLIDFYSEGIATTLFKKEEHPLYETIDVGQVEGSFYLIYRNRELPSEENPNPPVDIFFCGDSYVNVFITASTYSGEISWDDLDEPISQNGDGYIIYRDDSPSNPSTSVAFSYWVNKKEKQTETFTLDSSHNAILLTPSKVAIGNISANGFSAIRTIKYKAWVNRIFDNFTINNVNSIRQIQIAPSDSVYTTSYVLAGHLLSKVANYQAVYGSISSIIEVNRADPKLLKIIKLPYRPVEYQLNEDGDLTYIPNNWVYEDSFEPDFPSMLRFNGNSLSSLQTRMFLEPDEEYDDEYVSPFEIAKNRTISTMGYRVEKNISFETKLLHSDFYLARFVYDSFTYDYNLEYLNTSDLGAQNLYVDYYVSLSMSSKFMFKQSAYLSFMGVDVQNYSGIVYVIRNNEVPIFNSEYLNYIKAGYNYDVKTRNRQLTSNIVGTSLAFAGAIGSFASSVVSGGLGITAGIGLLTTAIGGIYKTISNTAQADQNIAQKLKQSEMQGVSVSGADDVDLLTEYADDNKAKIVVYEASEKMKNALFDLFYYCGYIANIQGVPNTTSRKVFNFIQAEVLFNITPNLPKEIVDDIVAKYKEGITFLHHYTLRVDSSTTTRGWDFEQQYENWETEIE